MKFLIALGSIIAISSCGSGGSVAIEGFPEMSRRFPWNLSHMEVVGMLDVIANECEKGNVAAYSDLFHLENEFDTELAELHADYLLHVYRMSPTRFIDNLIGQPSYTRKNVFINLYFGLSEGGEQESLLRKRDELKIEVTSDELDVSMR